MSMMSASKGQMGASDPSSNEEPSPLPFWSLPLPASGICFVDNPLAFEEVVRELRSAAIVGLDCEWRPVASRKGRAASRGSPKVAVLQIACRRRGGLKDEKREAVYVLDMLALQPSTFAGPLKAMLSSPHILKLGYAFRDDLRHLAASHPGQDSRGCFDKVDNFVDVGKLFHTVKGGSDSWIVGTGGLSAIASTVLGLPLDKELQCSDWEARPLSSAQLLYAATDAYCLLPIYDALLQGSSEVAQPGLSPQTSSSQKPFRPLSIAAALDLNPPTPDTADVSTEPLCRSATCILSSRGISPAEAATAASLSAAGLDGSLEDVALAMGRFAERLTLNAINHGAGSKKPKKRQGAKPRRPPDAIDGLNALDDCEWSGPPPWEEDDTGEPRFLCDVHVEGLARQLRCVGFDTASAAGPRADARQMVEQAEREGRVLLTRDRRLIRRRLLPPNKAYLVKALGKQAQLREVLSTFKLGVRARRLLCRCIKCNGNFVPEPLGPREAAAAAPWSQVIPECALRAHTEFWQCGACRHIYWEGTQFQRAILQFEAAFEGIMEGTVAEDRFSRSGLVAAEALGDADDSGIHSRLIVGYCTEPGEEFQKLGESSENTGPMCDPQKIIEGGCETRGASVEKEPVAIENERAKRPCKSCAERRQKKAERRQLLAAAAGATID